MKNLIKQLQAGITERGNTALINYESGGSVLFCELAFGLWLEVSIAPENYPAFNVGIIKRTTAEIRTHIEENLCDTWTFLKNNVRANSGGNQPVELAYVMERVRDHYYVYRDNIDFEAEEDTVTVIHNYLESKKWSLDITDIENLRQEFDEDK